MSGGISIREFARREDCDDKLVRRGIQQGRLVTLPDGTIDPALVGSSWRKTNRRRPPVANAEVRAAEMAAQPGPELPQLEAMDAATAAVVKSLVAESPLLSILDAERLKENYLARLRQLEYDQKSGRVVLVEDVTAAVGKKFADVRSKLDAIPAKVAPKLSRLKTPAQIQDALREEITWALEELTVGDAGGL